MSLVAATRSESTKVFSTSGWWIIAIVLVVYIGGTAAGLGFLLSALATGAIASPNGQGMNLPAENIPPLLYSIATSVGYVFPLLIGTLMVTSEFRHQTLTPTFLATPRRGRVLGAKVLVGILMGVVFAVIAIVSATAPAAGLLAGYGLDTQFSSADTWAMQGRIVIAFALWVLVGIGAGALLRNQVAAIVIVLAFTQFVEPIARFAATQLDGLDSVTKYLPGAAGDALVGASIFTFAGGPSATASTPLEWWVGGLVLAAYAVVLLILGHLFSWRRDVS